MWPIDKDGSERYCVEITWMSIERVNDISCEQLGFTARGMLVKVGETAVRGCNVHIGVRILQDKEVQKASMNLHRGPARKETVGSTSTKAVGVQQIIADDGNADLGAVTIIDVDDAVDPLLPGDRKEYRCIYK